MVFKVQRTVIWQNDAHTHKQTSQVLKTCEVVATNKLSSAIRTRRMTSLMYTVSVAAGNFTHKATLSSRPACCRQAIGRDLNQMTESELYRPEAKQGNLTSIARTMRRGMPRLYFRACNCTRA